MLNRNKLNNPLIPGGWVERIRFLFAKHTPLHPHITSLSPMYALFYRHWLVNMLHGVETNKLVYMIYTSYICVLET